MFPVTREAGWGSDQEAFAGAPGDAKNPNVDDEVAIAGLEKAHVDQFESLGFPRTKVVRASSRILSIS